MKSALSFAAAVLFLATSSAESIAQQQGARSLQVIVIQNKSTIREFRGAIIAAGHDCPDIKLAFTEFVMNESKVSMVYCGIGRANNVAQFPALLYRIINSGGPLVVVPW